MPHIHVKTNIAISSETELSLKAQFGQAITLIPRKTERWLMCSFSDHQRMWLSGSNEPAASIELSLYGQMDRETFTQVSGKLTLLVSEALGIAPDRIYCHCVGTDLWSWNGTPFG